MTKDKCMVANCKGIPYCLSSDLKNKNGIFKHLESRLIEAEQRDKEARDAKLLKKHNEIINCVEQIKADIRYYLVKTRDEPLFYEELMGADGQVEFGLNKIKKLLSSPKPEEKKKGGRK